MTEKNKKNSTEPELMIDRADERIARAAEGLIFISETDAPIEPFRWDKGGEVTVGVVREMAGMDADSPAEEADADAFFSKLTVKKEWYGEREIERAERFAGLYAALQASLSDLPRIPIRAGPGEHLYCRDRCGRLSCGSHDEGRRNLNANRSPEYRGSDC